MKGHLHLTLKLFWGGLATLLIGFALLIQLGREVLPLLPEWREDLEHYLSVQLGGEVKIEEIRADWDGLKPQISIKNLRFSDTLERETLTVGRAIVQLDILHSLLGLAMRFERVEIDEVSAVLSQELSGQWQLAGYAPNDRREKKTSSIDLPSLFLSLNDVDLNNIQLQFEFRSGRQQGLKLTSLLLQNDLDFHRLVANLDLPDQDETLKLIYEAVGHPGERNFEGRGYLTLNRYPLKESVSFASESAAQRSGISDGFLSASVWLSSQAGEPILLDGEFELARNQGDLVDDEIPAKIKSNIKADWHPLKGWQLQLQELQALWLNRASQPLDIIVSGQFEQKDIHIQLAQVDIAYWVNLVDKLGLFPETASRILGELDPHGELSNVNLRIAADNPKQFLLQANLQGVSVNDWKGSPGIKQLYGYVEASALAGVVQIDSQNSFLMEFPQLYEQPFVFKSAVGEVGWKLDVDNNQVLVNSSRLKLHGDLGDVNGYFYLDAPLKRGSRLIELILQIGLVNGKISDHRQLIPQVVPERIKEWSSYALGSGTITTGGFSMQGYFGRTTAEQVSLPHSIQVALNVKDAQLDYDQRWPELKNISGFVHLDIPGMNAWVDSGEILGAAIQTAQISLTNNSQGDGQLLTVKGDVDGGADAGLKALTQTPLRDVLGSTFDQWSLEGGLQAQLELKIPLSSNQLGHYQKVDVTIDRAALDLNDINLHFTELNGKLNFETGKGLNASGITAKLWEEPIVASIASISKPSSSTAFTTSLSFSTKVDFDDLAAWTHRPELRFVEGKAAVAGGLDIDGAEVMLRTKTNLKGALIELPAPFGKRIEELRPLTVEVPIGKGGYSVLANYDDLLFLHLNLPEADLPNGTISLQDIDYGELEGVWLKGSMEEVNGREWLEVIQRQQKFAEVMARGKGKNAEKAGAELNLDLKADIFNWDEWQLEMLSLSGKSVVDGWHLRVDNERVAGDVRLFSDQQRPQVDLDYVRWPAPAPIIEGAQSEVAPSPEDPLRDFDPRTIQPLQFSVNELNIGGEDYGRWSLLIEPTAAGLCARNVQGAIRNIVIGEPSAAGNAIEAKAPAAGAELYWEKFLEGESTRFLGVIHGKNVRDITDAWSFPPMMESRSLRAEVAFNWSGSPAMLSIKELQGDLLLDVRDGRFYQNTGQASNALLRLVGLFNFDSWARRLKLDFKDVFKGGLPFEYINGAMKFEQGTIYLSQPLEVKNTSATMKMGGEIDLLNETLDTSLVATLPVGGNATFLTALAAGLPAAAGVYLASKIFKKQMEKVASVSYTMTGPWEKPIINFDKLFDSNAAEKASQKGRADAEQEKAIAGEVQRKP